MVRPAKCSYKTDSPSKILNQPVNDIPRQSNQVRVLTADRSQQALVFTAKRAAMQVGNLHNAEAVKLFWNSAGKHPVMGGSQKIIFRKNSK